MTDNGIQWLCYGGNYPGMGYGKPRLCKTLQNLNILRTSVTQKGIQVALRYLFSLKVLNSYNTFNALVELAQLAKDSNRPGLYNDKFSISILYTPCDHPISSESIRLALSLCNLVNRVAIHATEGLKDSDLLCLLSLNQLYGLRILESSSKSEITFDGGVVPLLKNFGKSLGILSFQHFDSVRISTIAEFCPNLTSLKVNYKARRPLRGGSSVDNESDILLMKDKLPLFKNLKTLFCEGDIQPDILLCLLSSPLLHRLVVHYCETFSDEVLQKAADFHGFQNLQVLDLFGCNSVSKRGIEALLVDSNPLHKISLCFCKNLSSWEWLRSMIVRRNWNVECMLLNK